MPNTWSVRTTYVLKLLPQIVSFWKKHKAKIINLRAACEES